ncbi:MAG TPA: ABC transporter C-terminal domain-containing protein, partial [Longimicrobiaceae bacterium]|nr:ABC transporter C-terminal domain-containing protein [Longimicrobiaceae bacterium]
DGPPRARARAVRDCGGAGGVCGGDRDGRPSDGVERRRRGEEQRELEGIEDAILLAEAEKDELAARLADPSLYAASPEEVARVTAAFHDAEARVEALYTRWAELEEIRSAVG